MLWAILRPSPPSLDVLDGLATWALSYTPRVAIVEEATLAELDGSARLFGGRRALRDLIVAGAAELGVDKVAWAPTGLGGLAIARAGAANGFAKPIGDLLARLPMEHISALRPHAEMLGRLGCRTVGDVRALPRGGLSRRFGAEIIAALDQAYGIRPEVYPWKAMPETFHARLELQARVEHAPAMLFGARRLLIQLCAWLRARRSGTTAFTLRWVHDDMRDKNVERDGLLTVRTAEPTRDIEHLSRLLAEHLAHAQLGAPASDLAMLADEVHALEEISASLLPDEARKSEPLALLLERAAAKLGPDRVLQAVPQEDHRLEWMSHWSPAPLPKGKKTTRTNPHPQPTWVFPRPVKLAVQADSPMYLGPLQLVMGPHRIESGWWDRDGDTARSIQRDYWVAVNEHAGVVWVFHERLGGDGTAWYLHGAFA